MTELRPESSQVLPICLLVLMAAFQCLVETGGLKVSKGLQRLHSASQSKSKGLELLAWPQNLGCESSSHDISSFLSSEADCSRVWSIWEAYSLLCSFCNLGYWTISQPPCLYHPTWSASRHSKCKWLTLDMSSVSHRGKRLQERLQDSSISQACRTDCQSELQSNSRKKADTSGYLKSF